MIGPACRAVRPLLLLLALLWPEGTGGRTDTCLEVANDNIDQLLRDVHSAGHVIVNLLDGEVVRNGSTLDQTLLRRFLFSQIRAVPASLERLSFGNKDGLFMSFANNRTFRNESFVYDFMASVNASCGPPYNISTGCAQSFRLASVISGKPGAVRSTWSGFDIRDRPFYKRARSHGLGFTRLATKLPVFGGQVGLDMVRPVYISGDFYGAVFASLAVDEISDRLASVVDATRPQKRAGSPFLWRSPGHDLMFMVTAGGQLLGDSKKTCSGGTNASDCSSFLLARSYRLMKKHKYKAGSKHFFRRKDRKSSVFSVAIHQFDGALASSLAEDWFILRVQKEDLSGDHVQARSQQGAAIIFFAVATVLTSLGAALLVYWKRDTNTMKFAQYKVLIVRLFSFAFLGLGSLALLGENTPNLCELRIWAICIPCNCVLASFIIKFLKIIKFVPPSENRRMSKVRRSVALIKTVTSARRHFTDLKASAVFLILIAPTLLLCAVSWGLGTARPKLQIYTDSDSNDVGYPLPSPLRPALTVLLDVSYTPQAARLKCSDKYLLELLSWSFMMLLTLIATFFAFKTRILNSHLSDTNVRTVRTCSACLSFCSSCQDIHVSGFLVLPFPRIIFSA